MSAEIVLLLIGGLFLLLTLLDSVNIRIRVLLGVVGIILIIYAGYSYGMLNPQAQIEQVDVGNKITIDYPVKKVQLISPIEGDSVKCRILSMGVYPSSHEKDLWVLLKPSDNRYYPQSDHTNTSYKRNGEWQVITRFGGDKGELYELIVYETDSLASEFFSATISDWKKEESFPGLELEEIPKGATEIERIDIYLEENCRGVF